MKNYKKPGQELDIASVPSGGYVAGRPYAVGTLVGISAGNYAQGEKGVLTLCGVYALPNPDGTSFGQGVAAAWDATNNKLVATTTGDFEVGTAVEASVGTNDVLVLLPLGPYAFNGM